MQELQWFFVAIVGLFILWFLTGGPDRARPESIRETPPLPFQAR